MHEESAISIWRKLPETKAQVEQYAGLIRQSVLDGEVDPLLFAAQVSAMEKLFTTLKSDILIKDVILEEAEKYGKSFEKGNAKFCIKEVGVTYDYTDCQDEEWEQLDSSLKMISERKKKREEFLKAISPDAEIYGANGIQIIPPAKRSSTQVTVILK